MNKEDLILERLDRIEASLAPWHAAPPVSRNSRTTSCPWPTTPSTP